MQVVVTAANLHYFFLGENKKRCFTPPNYIYLTIIDGVLTLLILNRLVSCAQNLGLNLGQHHGKGFHAGIVERHIHESAIKIVGAP